MISETSEHISNMIDDCKKLKGRQFLHVLNDLQSFFEEKYRYEYSKIRGILAKLDYHTYRGYNRGNYSLRISHIRDFLLCGRSLKEK